MSLWILCGIFFLTTTFFALKQYFLKKGIDELCLEFKEHLSCDTNTLLSVSSNDKHIRRLAMQLNAQLKDLRAQRREYLNGNMELKEAVTNISHDLRTPLTAISGYLDLLEDEEHTKKGDLYLSIIKNRCELLKQLTEELFAYSVALSEAQQIKQEPTHLNRVLEESIAAFYAEFQKRSITPQIHITEKKIVRAADCSALSRVFSNILQNAVKYSSGDLEILLDDSGMVTFTNTAYGLNEITAGKLFDRFFTIENATQSTGIGLSIAKTFLTQMGGSIFARYKENKLSISIVLQKH